MGLILLNFNEDSSLIVSDILEIIQRETYLWFYNFKLQISLKNVHIGLSQTSS